MRNFARHNALQKRSALFVFVCSWFAFVALGGCAPYAAPAQLEDRTSQGAPPQLLREAERLLKGRVIFVEDYNYQWSSQTLFRVYTSGGKDGMFLERHDDYIQLNTPASLNEINVVLRDRRFPREAFGNAESVFHYLSVLVDLYEGPHRFIGSSTFLGVLGPDGMAEWSRGSKKKDITLRELCRDAHFVFEGSNWVVRFHVFEPDGRVEQWQVAGEFNAATQSNAIHKIARRVVQKRGTFAFAAWG